MHYHVWGSYLAKFDYDFNSFWGNACEGQTETETNTHTNSGFSILNTKKKQSKQSQSNQANNLSQIFRVKRRNEQRKPGPIGALSTQVYSFLPSRFILLHFLKKPLQRLRNVWNCEDLLITRIVFRPDITEIVDCQLKTSIPTYQGLPTSWTRVGSADRQNPCG